MADVHLVVTGQPHMVDDLESVGPAWEDAVGPVFSDAEKYVHFASTTSIILTTRKWTSFDAT